MIQHVFCRLVGITSIKLDNALQNINGNTLYIQKQHDTWITFNVMCKISLLVNTVNGICEWHAILTLLRHGDIYLVRYPGEMARAFIGGNCEK